MRLQRLTVSDICQTDKYYRLIHAFKSRLEQLALNGYIGEDYRDIEATLTRYTKLYNVCSGWRLEAAYRGTYKRLVSIYGWSTKEHLAALGVKEKPRFTNNGGTEVLNFLQMMEKANKRSMANAWSFRLHQECVNAVNKGWFIIFDTLTIRMEHYDEAFRKGSKLWRNYIKSFARRVPGGHKYFACTERGRLGRLHLHVLHFCENIPRGTKDPNFGKRDPRLREISSLKALWPYGYSTPRAVRLGASDAWALKGWRWPAENNQPIKAEPVEAIANYLSKYVTKSLETKGLPWRVKTTRNLGMENILQKLSMLTDRNLYRLLSYSIVDNLKIGNRILPPRVLKLAILKEMKSRGSLQNFKKLIMTQHSRTRLPSLVKSLILKIQIFSQLNSGKSINLRVTSELFPDKEIPAAPGYCKALDQLRKLLEYTIPIRDPVPCATLVG